METIFILAISLLEMTATVNGRDVPALRDICGRAQWSFCAPSQASDNSIQHNQNFRAADLPQTNSAPSAVQSPSLNAAAPPASAQFPVPVAPAPASAAPQGAVAPCSSYTAQYTRYCSQPTSIPQLVQFCQTYLTYCINPQTNTQPQPQFQPGPASKISNWLRLLSG